VVECQAVAHMAAHTVVGHIINKRAEITRVAHIVNTRVEITRVPITLPLSFPATLAQIEECSASIVQNSITKKLTYSQ
jgi:hypothetical protein